MECERGATARLEEPRSGPKGLAPRGSRISPSVIGLWHHRSVGFADESAPTGQSTSSRSELSDSMALAIERDNHVGLCRQRGECMSAESLVMLEEARHLFLVHRAGFAAGA